MTDLAPRLATTRVRGRCCAGCGAPAPAGGRKLPGWSRILDARAEVLYCRACAEVMIRDVAQRAEALQASNPKHPLHPPHRRPRRGWLARWRGGAG